LKKAVNKIFVLYLGACGLAFAQTESRSDLVDKAREQKEANLSPESSPKGEQRFESIEKSIPYKLLTGEYNGFGLGFGTIIPGSGFAMRPRYTRTDLWDGKLTLRIDALVAINQSYMGGLTLAMPSVFKGRGFWEFSTVHRDISEMPYYGPGPDSRKTGRSDYRLEDTNVEFRPGVRIFKGLRASLIGSYLLVNAGPGYSSRFISSDKQYSEFAAPGIVHQTDFLRGGGLIEYDWRNNINSPTKGGRYSAQYLRYEDRNLNRYSFLRLDLDASQYIPLFNHTRVIALRSASSLTDTNRTQVAPFYLQPTLGGPDTLRGYRFNRFYGKNSTMASAEYRWDCSHILQMVAFFDGGKVFNDWKQWNYHAIQTDVGFGFRFRGRSSRNVFSFDTGFSHEGFQLWFRMNNAVQSRAL
jgi:hypothetical protein